jgi:predicted GTPase
VVLFMVDARAGLMPADIAIAKHLRSREKPTFLVVHALFRTINTTGIDTDEFAAFDFGPTVLTVTSQPYGRCARGPDAGGHRDR